MPSIGKKHKVYPLEDSGTTRCQIHTSRGKHVPAAYRVLTFEAGMRLEEFVCKTCLDTEYSIEPEEFVRE